MNRVTVEPPLIADGCVPVHLFLRCGRFAPNSGARADILGPPLRAKCGPRVYSAREQIDVASTKLPAGSKGFLTVVLVRAR